VARDPGHAATQRMGMALLTAPGVALKALTEQSTGAERRTHYEEAVEAFEATRARQPALEQAGFLLPGDTLAMQSRPRRAGGGLGYTMATRGYEAIDQDSCSPRLSWLFSRQLTEGSASPLLPGSCHPHGASVVRRTRTVWS